MAISNITQINGLLINAATASYTVSASYAATAGTLLGSVTSASYAGTASYLNALNQNVVITGSLTLTNNLTVFGSASITNISQSTLNIGTNLITVNSNSPAMRFGGLAVIDSGSAPQVSGSILFDSTNDQWIFVHQSSPPTSSVLIMGPETYSNIGNETNLTNNRIPKSVNAEHIGDSNITDTGTVVSINSNTLITGSLTVSSSNATQLLVGTSSLFVSGSGRIGAGTLLPTAQVHISASDSSSAYSFLVQNGFGQTLMGVQNDRTVNINSTNQTNGNTTIGTTNGTITFNQGYNNVLLRNALTFYNGGDASTIQGFTTNPGIAVGYAQTPSNPNTGSVFTVKGTVASSGSGVLFVTGSSATKLLTIASEVSSSILVVSGSGNVSINSTGSDALLYVRNTGDVSGGNKTSVFEHRFGVNALTQTQRYGVIVRAAPGDGTTALGITNQAYNTVLQGYDYTTNAYRGVSLSPLGGSVSIGRNLAGTADDVAKFIVRGLSSGSATTTLRVENLNASASLVVLDNGFVGINTGSAQYNLDVNGTSRFISQSYYGTFSESPSVYSSDTSGNYLTSAASLAFVLRNGAGGSGRFIFSGSAKAGTTTATQYLTQLTSTYNPTSGTGLYTMLELTPTINQTGGANGITRGIYINSTLQSAADYRAIETTAGSVIFSGTSSSLTIGTSSAGSTENTIVVGPPPAGGAGEGGQILLQASGGLYTSASMLDNYQNQFRILRGTNAGSDGFKFSVNMYTGQVQIPNYNSPTVFTGSAVAGLGVDSNGNIVSSTRTGRYGTALSGSTIGTGVTAQTIVYSQLIPANTYGSDDIFRTYFRFRKLATNGNATYNILVNTSNAVAGATTLATLTANTVHNHMKRDFYIAQGNATTSVGSGVSTNSDDVSNTQTISNIAWTSDQYLIYTVTLNTLDSGYGLGYTIEQVL